MELIINFLADSKQVSLQLLPVNDGLIIDLDIHFDTVLVTSIDKLIKRNRIDKSSLNMVRVTPETDDGSVAYRTAQAIAKAIKS